MRSGLLSFFCCGRVLRRKLLVALLLCCFSAMPQAGQLDPYESFNRKVFSFNESTDRWLLKPVAKAYRWLMPGPIDRAVSNVFDNFSELRNALNSGLQGDFSQTAIASGRFCINSMAGLLGVFDVATGFGLQRRDEDFGQTLAVWGVDSGAYLMLPFLGGSSLRDAFALPADNALSLPSQIDDVSARNGAFAVDIIDTRADLLDAEALLSGDRYLFLRDIYFQQRQRQIDNGLLEDDFDSDF